MASIWATIVTGAAAASPSIRAPASRREAAVGQAGAPEAALVLGALVVEAARKRSTMDGRDAGVTVAEDAAEREMAPALEAAPSTQGRMISMRSIKRFLC